MPHGVRSTYSNITCTRLRATQGAANVVENHGRITGYSTGIGFFSHAVAETNDDLAALIGAEHSVDGPGLLLPLREPICCVGIWNEGHTMNLMTIGQYQSRRHPIWRR